MSACFHMCSAVAVDKTKVTAVVCEYLREEDLPCTQGRGLTHPRQVFVWLILQWTSPLKSFSHTINELHP